MKLFLEVEQGHDGTAKTVTVRLLVLNDSYEPVALDRRLLIGPNAIPERPTGAPFPVSVEPALPREDQNVIHLNPWCLYGRQRPFEGFPPGRVTFHGYLLRQPSDS